MKCFYCKIRLNGESVTDICDRCIFHLDEKESEYDEYLDDDIEAILNKTGVKEPKYYE